MWRWCVLAEVGRSEEAIQEARRATEIDPLSESAAANVAFVLYFARRYDEVISAARKAIANPPTHPTAYAYLAWGLLAKGRTAEAIESYEKAVSIAPLPYWSADVGWLYGLGWSAG